MSNPNRLYALLPSIYRQRDLAQGSPLRELLRVIAEQVDVVEADIDQLYENWFIETCQDWVVPYIAELIGYRVAAEAGPPGDSATPQGLALNRVLFPRREIANTVRYRRRKGTLALLELLANDVAQWPARAVEFYTLLGWTQHLNHLNPSRGRTLDLRDTDSLRRIDSPFDRVAHTVEVASIQARRDLSNVGVFIWRLKPYSVTHTPAYCLEEVGPHCYTFSVLGNDTPLFTRPDPETDPTHIAEPLNLPVPISRFAFAASPSDSLADSRIREQASPLYYGRDRSLAIWADGWVKPVAGKPVVAGDPIPLTQIIPADLSHWQYRPPPNYIAVDPEHGRIVFPPSQLPKQGVRVYYHYGFSDNVGGGEYARPLEQNAGATVYPVGQGCPYSTINQALAQTQEGAANAVIEIMDSRVYTEPFNQIQLRPNQNLQIRAASGARPVIRLLDYQADFPDSFNVVGDVGSTLTLDGLLLMGRGVRLSGDLAHIVVRHCTLVPGWAPDSRCEPRRPTEPSLELFNVTGDVLIDRSIIGSIQINRDEVQTDPISITLADSILDATSHQIEAIGAPGCPVAHASLRVYRSTVIGYSQVHAMPLAENSIFMGKVTVARRQTGCVRFCYVPPGSKTPRRYRCQPDLVEAAASVEAKDQERQRVRPKFNSQRYGQPAYCQLAHLCADEIKRGADDGSEMGVFHNLFEPQRQAILRARLDEFTPADMTAGLIYAT